MVLANKVIYQNGAIREFAKPEVCEAIKVANANRCTVGLSPIGCYERDARLKKDLEEHANAPVSGKEKAKKGNPALKEAASQFNDALLDEQSKQIGEQTEKIKKLEHEKLDILEIASSSKQTIAEHGKKIKHLGKEITRLNKIIHNKNEELRLTKIREKNLAGLGLKYVGENGKLKKKLADRIVDEIDARALKSSESALAYKEKVIAEKDEVIADLCNELAATKKELEEKTRLVEEVRKYSKEYREYGIGAVKMIRKMAKAIVCEKPICSEDFKEYRRLANGCSFNPQLPDLSEEEDKKLSPVKDDNSNGDVTNQKDISPSLKVTVRLFGDDVIDLFKNMQHLW